MGHRGSQQAVEKLGALRDEVLRANVTRPNGSQRDTVVHPYAGR